MQSPQELVYEHTGHLLLIAKWPPLHAPSGPGDPRCGLGDKREAADAGHISMRTLISSQSKEASTTGMHSLIAIEYCVAEELLLLYSVP